ncbi:hypothetical protein H5410_017287 [Solanum commersonii]|uniref:Uncharacterized protein n=1 Tax=Solanum commersonii TaxID=4109 RepID=A0A9J6A032_SOLCO|nr:hypothetical protein H5410_017287 [Solanum commersonii]
MGLEISFTSSLKTMLSSLEVSLTTESPSSSLILSFFCAGDSDSSAIDDNTFSGGGHDGGGTRFMSTSLNGTTGTGLPSWTFLLIITLYCCFQTNFHSYIIGYYIIGDFAAYPTGKSSVAIDGLPIGYILQYHVKLGLNQKLLLAIDASSAALHLLICK